MLARAACGLGIGLVAGLVGTAAITLSQQIAMRFQGRKPSSSPVKAVSKVFGIQPIDMAAEARLNTLVHWGYGTTWGAARGLMTVFGLRGPWADVIHWGAVQGTAMVMLPRLKVAPPVREWGTTDILVEGLHHVVYVTAVGLTSDALCRSLASAQPPSRLPWAMLASGVLAEGLRRTSRRRPERISRLSDRVRTSWHEVSERLPVGAGR
ncbi:hypothetical protein D3C87_842050 [compost metagenome]